MRKKFKRMNNKGSSLVMVLIAFFILSLIGTTILIAASSEYRLTKIDSKSQSAYYIAESGLNYMYSTINNILKDLSGYSSENEFFSAFEMNVLNKEYVFDGFEENSGEQPVAKVRMELEEIGENYRDYYIESIGRIGVSSRSVSATITLTWEESISPVIDDLLLYTKGLVFKGNNLYGSNGITVSEGIGPYDLNHGNSVKISTMYFNGSVSLAGSSSLGNQDYPGTIYINGDFNMPDGTRHIYGDVRVKGNLLLKDAVMHGDVYVDGNLTLDWTPVFHKKIYYTGDISYPQNFSKALLDKCIKVESVDSWEVPVRDVSLRDNNWYRNHGYEIKGNTSATVPDNARWVVDNYNYSGWPKYDINDGYLDNIVIVSKGDIIINTASRFTGALIAPNGAVEITQGGTLFEGVIVSKDRVEFSGGGSNATLMKLQDLFDEDEIPVIFSIPGENRGGSTNPERTNNIVLSVKSGIKEEP